MYNNKQWILSANLNVLWLLMERLILCYVSCFFFLNTMLIFRNINKNVY